MLVSELLNPRKNNFDLFRLIAALLVIYGHASGLVLIPNVVPSDFVGYLLRFDYSGSLAVKFFFMLSGLLVTASFISNPNMMEFIVKRAARIFPGLFVCLCISVFIVGPWFTKLSLQEYFTNSQTWSYLINNTLLYELEWRLPGVFDDSKYGLNGSLWTLPLEVVCYLFLAAIYGLGIWRIKWLANIILLGVVVISFFAPQWLTPLFANNQESRLLPGCFALGALFATNQNFIVINRQGALALSLLAALLWSTPLKPLLFYLAFFYCCLFLGSCQIVVEKLKMRVDASYGVYIYGFLVQQCVGHLFPQQGVLFNQVVSGVIAIGLGIASWRWVEQPAMFWVRKMLADKRDQANGQLAMAVQFNHILAFLTAKRFYTLVGLMLVAWFMHFIALYFIFPGHYNPLAYHHSDFYIATSFAYAPEGAFSFSNLLNWPRPFCMWLLKFTGYFGLSGSIAWVVGVVFANAALSALLVKHCLKLNVDRNFILCFALYCWVLFTQPFFYTFYSQDIGSQYSYLLLLCGSIAFIKLEQRQLLLASVLLFVASTCALLVKETYYLAFGLIYLCWFFYYLKQNFLRALAPGLAVFVAGVISALVNFKTKSVFVNLEAEAGSSYQISIQPLSVLKELARYAYEGITPFLIVAFALIIYQLHKSYKNKLLTLAAIVCGGFTVMSWLPNALLPNHHYEGYSFNGFYISGLLLFFVLKMVQDKISFKSVLIILLILVVFSPASSIPKYNSTRNTYVVAMEKIQKNIRAGLTKGTSQLKDAKQPVTVLISGISSPFHPFGFPQSIRAFPYGDRANYIFVVPKDFPNNLGTSMDLVKYIAAVDIEKQVYDQEWQFDDQGNLVAINVKN